MNDKKHTVEDIARCAAKWWADLIREKKSGNTGDARTDRLTALLVSTSPRPSEESLALFQGALSVFIIERLGKYDSYYLSVDYSPDHALAAALDVAGIQFPLPPKTAMLVERDKIQVSDGYGVPLSELSIF